MPRYHPAPMPKPQPRTSTPPDRFRILLVGGGAREHALAWKLAQSPRLDAIFTSHPENPGIAALASPVDCPIDPKAPFRIQRFCDNQRINLVVIGPEAPLAAGLADVLAAPGRAVLGPTAAGARLEASKSWAKRLMRAASIPTADARVFTNPSEAKAFLKSREYAYVVKASGLASGKGVVVPESLDEALDAVDRIMVKKEFGDAGAEIVVEERMTGPEASVFALVDGRTIALLETAQDHKRLLDGDKGPNTGGMGAFSPSTRLNEALLRTIQKDILVPTVDALRREDIEFRGVLFVGLMLTPGGPRVLEYNCRFGDPECQALVPRLRADLPELLWRTASGALDEADIDWDPRPTCCVVLASHGYPQSPRAGDVITGIDEASKLPDTLLFHAGTKRNERGDIVTTGGRVLSVVATADTLPAARERAMQAAELIQFDGKHYRRDIAAPAT